MDEKLIINMMHHLNSRASEEQNREEWLTFTCPLAKWRHQRGTDTNPSFGVSKSDKGGYRYYCFSCESHGNLSELPYTIKMLLGQEDNPNYNTSLALKALDGIDTNIKVNIKPYGDKEGGSKGRLVVFPEEYLEHYRLAYDVPIAREYLQSRKVSLESCKHFDIRFDQRAMRVCFPIRDHTKSLVGFHGRDITGKSKLPYLVYTYNKSSTNIVWVNENNIDPNKPVILTESVFDMTSIWRVYKNVICSLSCGIGLPKLNRLKGIHKLLTLYDYGKGGDRAREKISKVLNKAGVLHLSPTEKQDDAGEMTKLELVRILNQHIKLRGNTDGA